MEASLPHTVSATTPSSDPKLSLSDHYHTCCWCWTRTIVIGQYPDTFSAAVLRNPVISSQPASTDIPDWYFSEFGVRPSTTESEQMTPELYAQLYPTSPIA